ncbi:MAG: hypothetical protein JJ979_27105 [Roseibium sp.]|nr:hypothetical protein [Roseibium sp.]
MFGLIVRRATLSLRVRSLLLAATLTGSLTGLAQGGDIDKFNPATTDPDLFRIAVRHSDRLQVPVRGAKMRVVMTDKKSGRVLREKNIFLQKVSAEQDLDSIPSDWQGETVSVYRIPERQISELRALQAKFLAMPKSERDGIAGSLSIDVSGCKTDPNDMGEMLISTFMKSSEIGEFIVLAKDYDLRNVPAGSASKTADPVRPCT